MWSELSNGAYDAFAMVEADEAMRSLRKTGCADGWSDFT